jgi:hypothetical protein
VEELDRVVLHHVGRLEPLLVVPELAVEAVQVELRALAEPVIEVPGQTEPLAVHRIVADAELLESVVVGTGILDAEGRLEVVGTEIAPAVGSRGDEPQLLVAAPRSVRQRAAAREIVADRRVAARDLHRHQHVLRRLLGHQVDGAADRLRVHVRRDRLRDLDPFEHVDRDRV